MAKEFSLGVNLGVDYLTSVHITHSNEPVHVASIETSPEWKAHFLDTLRQRSDRPAATHEELLRRIIDTGFVDLAISTLLSIRRATEDILGRAVKIKTISYPYHYIGTPYIASLTTTAIAIEEYPEITNTLQVQSYHECTRRAYNLYELEALGYAPGTNLENESTLIVQVQYEREFLEVAIMEVDLFVNFRNRWFGIKDFGSGGKTSNVYGWSSPGRPSGRQVYEQAPDVNLFKVMLRHLLDDQFVPLSPRSEARMDSMPDKPENVRAVVFSGSASASECDKIKKAILQVEPMFEKWMRDEVEPAWVAARGAAVWSRDFDLMPPYGGRTF